MNPNISRVQFKGLEGEGTVTHERWEHYHSGVTDEGLRVSAHHPLYGEVGRMELDPMAEDGQPHEIKDVAVELRRHGIATAMYRHAEQAGLRPVHSPNRTDRGDAWARSVGGVIPPRSEKRYRGDQGYAG